MALSDKRAALVRSPAFRDRVMTLAAVAARNVQAEARDEPPTAQQVRRSKLAHATLTEPETYALIWTAAVVANVTIAGAGTDATDSELEFALGESWDAVAGVVD